MAEESPRTGKQRFTLHCAALHLTVEFSLRPGEFARIGASPAMEITLPMAGLKDEECRLFCDDDGLLWLMLPDGASVRNPEGFLAGAWHFVIKPEVSPPVHADGCGLAEPAVTTPRRKRVILTMGAAAALMAAGGLTVWLMTGEKWSGTQGGAAVVTPFTAPPVVSSPAVVTVPPPPATGMDLEEVAKRAKPCVFLLEARNAADERLKVGTAFAISAEGLIVTNQHLTKGAARFTAIASDGTKLRIARLLAEDAGTDLAILQLEKPAPAFLPLGSTEGISVGKRVAVYGNPSGLKGTLSEGIISARRNGMESGFDFAGEILQTTAPISEGSSGSPLLDGEGRVLGVMKGMLDGPVQNLNFAVPVEAVIRLRDRAARAGGAPEAPLAATVPLEGPVYKPTAPRHSPDNSPAPPEDRRTAASAPPSPPASASPEVEPEPKESMEAQYMTAVLYCHKMDASLLMLAPDFRSLAAEVFDAHEAWINSPFYKASQSMAAFLTKRHAKSPDKLFHPSQLEKFRKYAGPDYVKSLTEARALLRRAIDCTAGKFPDPNIRRHLLWNYYAGDAEAEFKSGYTVPVTLAEVNEPTVKFTVPMTWRRKDSPLKTVIPFVCDAGYSSLQCLVFTEPLPATSSTSTAEAFAAGFTKKKLEAERNYPGTTVTSFKRTEVKGYPAFRYVREKTGKVSGKTITTALQAVRVVHGGFMFEIQLMNRVEGGSREAAKDLSKYMPLLDLIVDSLVITPAVPPQAAPAPGSALAEGFIYTKEAAEKGDAASQCSLGQKYEHGFGVEKNDAEAARWYLKAAEQNNADGQFNLGLLYLNGKGVEKDVRKAVEWIRKSVACEKPNAMYTGVLNAILQHIDGKSPDPADAGK